MGSRSGGWDSTSPVCPGPTAGTEPGTAVPAQRPAPRQRPGRVGHGAEPGDSGPMAFPDRGPGEGGEQKGLSLPRAGQAGWDGAGFGSCAPAAVPFIPSCPILSHPTPWDHAAEKGGHWAVGCGVLPPHRDSLQDQGWGAWWGPGARKGWVGAGCDPGEGFALATVTPRDRPVSQQPRGSHLPQGWGQVEQSPRAEGAQRAGDR